jgi:hypothetical protein
MNLSNSQELELWLDTLKEQGGNLYVVNFYDYYKKHYCDKNSNIPELLLGNINILKNAKDDELFLFANSSDDKFEELMSRRKFVEFDFAAHVFSVLDEQFIKFLPIVIWSSKINLFSTENGHSRMLNKFINDNKLNCIHIRYPGHPELDCEKTIISNVQELYNSITYTGFENIKRYISIVKPHTDAYDSSVFNHGILSYGDKDFHEAYRLNWKLNILRYKSYAQTLNESNLNMHDLKYDTWNVKSPKRKVEYSNQNGGILKLRNQSKN